MKAVSSHRTPRSCAYWKVGLDCFRQVGRTRSESGEQSPHSKELRVFGGCAGAGDLNRVTTNHC